MTQITIPDVPTFVEYQPFVTGTGPFTVPFPFFAEGDVFATITNTKFGTLIRELVVTTDFTFDSKDVPVGQEGNGYEGGVISLVVAMLGADAGAADAQTIRIYRSTAIDRLANYPNTGPFAMPLLNDEQNRFASIMQEMNERFNEEIPTGAMQKDSTDSWWQGEGLPIKGIAVPTEELDAATKNYVDAQTFPNPGTGEFISVTAFGATGDGVTDDHASIQAAINASPGARVVFPPGTYLISEAIVVSSHYTALEITDGATIIVDDDGATYPSMEIDDTKVGIPQMKAVIALKSCTGARVFGGGTIDAAGLVFNATDGMSGVFVRDCIEAVVEQMNVMNVWPASKPLPGGEGDKRYTGILVLKSKRCIVRHNHVDHCKYDCIGFRMENEDNQAINNKCWDNFEGIQSSGQYGTITPIEENHRTIIADNECWDSAASPIVFHSLDVQVLRNFVHTPQAGTQGIRAIGTDKFKAEQNIITGIEGTTDEIETHDFQGIRAGATDPSQFRNNIIQFCHIGISLETNLVFYPQITGNTIWKCNTGIDVRDSLTVTRTRQARIQDNFIRVYRYGIRAQDKGPTRIVGNTIQEEAGWVGSSIGLDLDSNGNNDTEYYLSDSMPVNFSTNIAAPFAPVPPTGYYGIFFAQDMIAPADRYFNRGDITVLAGNTTANVPLLLSLPGNPVPGAGEIQITQMTGPPVAFTWAATAATLFITISGIQVSDCTFGWTAHMAGFTIS